MAIEVHCDCGNVYSVGPELSGKKLRCKTCNVVLKVPLVPLGDSRETVPPSMEYEVLKEGESTASVICATCGSPGKPGDAVCLSCGAPLGAGAPGLLERVPKPVILGAVGAILLGVVEAMDYKIYH